METKTEAPEAPKGVPSTEGKGKKTSENIMRTIKIEKVVLSVAAVGDELEKGVKLLKFLTGRKAAKMRSRKRIPTWGVRPGLEVGAVVTIRKGNEEMLKKMLAAIDNRLRRKQIGANAFAFGVKEYLEIPGTEYQRDIGIMGLDVTVVFKRSGRRVKLKKVKRGKFSKRQFITKEEIIKFMEDKFDIEFYGK
jgi:large subunit ribosomal protein L5